MVLLTITSPLVEGLRSLDEETRRKLHESSSDNEPDIASPAVGEPISHSQYIDISRTLKKATGTEYTLEKLLVGAKIYVAPPPPKPEHSDEYKALMARLRRDEENRAYERMINPPRLETFEQRFPNAPSISTARAYAEVNRPRKEDEGSDEISLNDVNKQLAVILNVIFSILGVAFTVWWITRWRSITERTLYTLFSAILTAVADAVVYAGFLRDIIEEKPKKAKEPEERKKVVQTWTVTAEKDGDDVVEVVPGADTEEPSNVRRRNKPPS